MDLLTSLGVNSSLFIQFGLFVVVYLVLKHVLFEPYVAAVEKRRERTVGQTDLAERFVDEARQLEEKFRQASATANDEYRSIYDKNRAETTREYDRVVGEARARARQTVDENRVKIQAQMSAARTQLAGEVSAVSHLINEKLIGKDVQV